MRFRFSQDSYCIYIYIVLCTREIDKEQVYNNRVAIISGKHERNKRVHYFSSV